MSEYFKQRNSLHTTLTDAPNDLQKWGSYPIQEAPRSGIQACANISDPPNSEHGIAPNPNGIWSLACESRTHDFTGLKCC